MEETRIFLMREVGNYTIDAWLRGVITLDEGKQVYGMWWNRIDCRIRRWAVANGRG